MSMAIKSLKGAGYGLTAGAFIKKYGRQARYELRGFLLCHCCGSMIDVTRIEDGLTILSASKGSDDIFKRSVEIKRHDGQLSCPLCDSLNVEIVQNHDKDGFFE